MTGLDPASAVAASKCLISRLRHVLDVSASHPRPCVWCEYPRADLARLLDAYLRESVQDRAAERFRSLPRSEQARLVREAQYPPAEA